MWKKRGSFCVFCTEAGLRKLHHSFGNPSAKGNFKLPNRVRPEDVERHPLDTISINSPAEATCQEHAIRLRRFRLTTGTNDHILNHIVAVDVIYNSQRPVLHVIDEAAHFLLLYFCAMCQFLSTDKTIVEYISCEDTHAWSSSAVASVV
jgi:hypothetical protein